MCCPVDQQLDHAYVVFLNEMRSAPDLECVVLKKASAKAAWSAIVEHRRSCPKCRARSPEALSSAGMPAWHAGIY